MKADPPSSPHSLSLSLPVQPSLGPLQAAEAGIDRQRLVCNAQALISGFILKYSINKWIGG